MVYSQLANKSLIVIRDNHSNQITKLKRFLQQEQIAFEIRNIEDMSIHQIRDQIHPETSQPKITEQKKLVNEIIKGLETERKQKEKQLAQAYEEWANDPEEWDNEEEAWID